ncbi:MAG: GAF domain-containing protein [Candidatus Thermoplasmatota archaeon]|nr:GAF domain-containing protein [Candidatus Thermoplasmatota archaeon]
MAFDEKKVKELMDEAETALRGSDPLEAVCRLLRDRVEHYDWVGFYLLDPERERELVIGPFAGEPTEHTNIGFGQGICGQAAETGKLFLVQDVTREENYLSCSPEVRSEIVLPIFRDGGLVGELDIDSHRSEPFTMLDTVLLEGICRMVSPYL